MAILIGFAVGYVGQAPMLQSHNPSIASTIAVLLSKFAGSALTKNLGRLQGVVLGTVVGQILYSFFGYCTAWGYMSIASCLAIWNVMALFIYYNSQDYSYVGLLLGVFGSKGLLQGCQSGVSNFEPSLAYNSVVDTIIAISIILAMDTFFASERASQLTYESYINAWRELREAVDCLFDPTCTEEEVDHKRNSIVGKVSEAASLADEAALEPRYWRVAWKQPLFAVAINTAFKMQVCITTIEYAAIMEGERTEGERTGTGTDDFMTSTKSIVSKMVVNTTKGTKRRLLNHIDRRDRKRKTTTFKAMVALPSFQKVGEMVKSKMDLMEKKLLPIFAHDTSEPMQSMLEEEVRLDWTDYVKTILEEFAADATAKGVAVAHSKHESLEFDASSQVAMIISSVDTLMFEMRHLQHMIIQSD